MDVPPLPDGDPLARDTRARLFELLGGLGRTATTDELATELDLHPNGVRRHLEVLQRAGLIRRDSVRQRRGRPKDGWTLDPDARPGGEPPRGYEELGRWLARAIPARAENLRQVEATGRGIGRELAATSAARDEAVPGSGLESFERAVTWLGFAPHSEATSESDADGVTYRLTNCPYRQAVAENQPVVCTLHRGILSGLLEKLEPDAEMTGFHPRDPKAAGCTVALLLRRRRAA
ncbi:MAG TPA: helix-turn-helix domain-containing protein [Solirubrobacteraceae bacterium]